MNFLNAQRGLSSRPTGYMRLMETRGERRSPESRAARALMAARKEAEEAQRRLALLKGDRPPAVVRRRRKFFAERLATAQQEELRQLERLGGKKPTLH